VGCVFDLNARQVRCLAGALSDAAELGQALNQGCFGCGAHQTRTNQRSFIYHLSTQHACTSAEGPRTTSGAVQSNRTNGASATPLACVGVRTLNQTGDGAPTVIWEALSSLPPLCCGVELESLLESWRQYTVCPAQ
jgi:hypothetical protein